NVVDVTNYVMLELGKPMHAFDYDRVQEGRLVVRLATPGERLTTLDGVDRLLDPQTLVVADAGRAASIAGIVGGASTEIRASTRRVLLEAASWHPPMIRRTSKRVGVRTESSARFERGIDTGAVLEAERMVRGILIRAGLTEALTVSLTTPADLDRLRVPPAHPWRSMVPLRNPLIEDHTHLRTTLLPGLLQAVRVNVSRSVTDAQIFEVGRTFHPSGASVAEHRRLA